MVKIRLKRMGANKKAFYRIVVADVRQKRDGRVIKEIGYYDPLVEGEKAVKVNKDLALEWLGAGAQPTTTVRNIFSKLGIMQEFHNIKANKSKQ